MTQNIICAHFWCFFSSFTAELPWVRLQCIKQIDLLNFDESGSGIAAPEVQNPFLSVGGMKLCVNKAQTYWDATACIVGLARAGIKWRRSKASLAAGIIIYQD